MKKIKFLSVLLLALTFGVVSVKALTVTEDLKLEEDLNEAIIVSKGKTVTIDLNGYNVTVTAANVDAISNYGTLTIKGSGVITAKGAAVVNYPEGVATLDNGEYLSTGWYTIKNMGTMTINNMKFGNNVNNGSSLIANGYYGNPANDRGQTAADGVMLTINGGTFENKNNSCNVVKNDDYGKLVINGGTFIAGSDDETNANPVIQNWHIATINDGTFTSGNGWVLANGYCHAVSDVGEMTIKGGTFTGSKGLFANNGGATVGKGVLTIKGGTFNGDATLSTVYETVIEGGIFDDNTVVPNEDSDYEAMEVMFGPNEGKTVIVKEEDLELYVVDGPVSKEDIEKEDLTLFEKAVEEKKYEIASYYEIDMVMATPDDDVVGMVSETEEPVEVTIGIPRNLPEVKEGFSRKYYVIRVHEGEVTVIDDVTVNDDGTLTFKSDKFSKYALAYEDVENEKDETTPIENEKTTTEVKEEKVVEAPKTFDGIITYIIIAVLAAALITYTSLYVKKRLS